MQEKKLLVFNWGGEDYGVEVDGVTGIAWNAWANRLPLPREIDGETIRPLPFLESVTGPYNGEAKRAVLINLGALQVAMIVDEIKAVALAETKEPTATLKIWRLAKPAADGEPGGDKT